MSDDPEGPHQTEANGGAALFAPGLLHELRQPLMGLRAGLELALRESGGQVSSLEGFRVVEAQVERLSEMVRGFEELFTAPRVQVHAFSLTEVVERAVHLLRFRLRPLGDRFQLQPAGEPLPSCGSASAVLHALTNLIVNAADAVSDAGPSARIAVRALAAQGGPRQVRVSDEGSGRAGELRASQGVVLIDDVEMHQDIAVQRALLPALRRALPRVQWIVTTSSPEIAQGCEASEVLALRRMPSSDRVELYEGELAVVH